MCELTAILTLGSTLLGAAGQIQQANATAAASKYNAQVAEMNSQIAENRAKSTIEAGARDEQMKRQQVQQVLGQQQAGMAANGVDLTFGSPLDTITDTAVLGELDALTIRTNTYREAYNARVDAANQRAGAELYRGQAKSAQSGGYIGAFGTILGGAGKAYGQYKKPGSAPYGSGGVGTYY
ncbi:hypothetical protein [Microvirga sp. TS319]|uniref:virion core protein, T7 gp14 family n=1 Tax=Microvirga sp. TS319 TaxID=3241165 RepID=UPI00351A5B60